MKLNQYFLLILVLFLNISCDNIKEEEKDETFNYHIINKTSNSDDKFSIQEYCSYETDSTLKIVGYVNNMDSIVFNITKEYIATNHYTGPTVGLYTLSNSEENSFIKLYHGNYKQIIYPGTINLEYINKRLNLNFEGELSQQQNLSIKGNLKNILRTSLLDCRYSSDSTQNISPATVSATINDSLYVYHSTEDSVVIETKEVFFSKIPVFHFRMRAASPTSEIVLDIKDINQNSTNNNILNILNQTLTPYDTYCSVNTDLSLGTNTNYITNNTLYFETKIINFDEINNVVDITFEGTLINELDSSTIVIKDGLATSIPLL